MDKSNINKFINKAVERTKTKELSWSLLTPSYNVKPLSNEKDLSAISNVIYGHNFLKEHSYFAPYKIGDVILLVFPEHHALSVFYPPNDCHLSLRMQDHNDKYSVEIANSAMDLETKSSLIRLYNLIDKQSLNVTALIEDFLNS